MNKITHISELLNQRKRIKQKYQLIYKLLNRIDKLERTNNMTNTINNENTGNVKTGGITSGVELPVSVQKSLLMIFANADAIKNMLDVDKQALVRHELLDANTNLITDFGKKIAAEIE